MDVPSSLIGPALSGGTPLSDGIDYIRVVLSLVLCLALGVGMAYLARRVQRVRANAGISRLALIETVRLDARTSVHAVRYGSRHALIATHAGGVAISLVESPDELPSAPGKEVG